MGLVTRSSTSRAEAPGISTKTSIMGTMICGSSSRGSLTTAKTPRRIEATTKSGVSLELMKAAASRPAMRRRGASFTLRPPGSSRGRRR